jgi:hypothetical protein
MQGGSGGTNYACEKPLVKPVNGGAQSSVQLQMHDSGIIIA